MNRVVMQGITKRFGPVVANDSIDFDLAAGEIHGLLGENGSGKTTLISILYGLVEPDEGTILLDGKPFRPAGPRESREVGIAMIPQRFRLVPTLSVAENVALGLEHRDRRHKQVLREVRARLLDLGRRYGLALDPDAIVESLSMGERQRVEILRALYHDAAILLMDEPTSVLTPGEVEGLFTILRRMVRDENRTVVLVTHKLREVVGLADRLTVLRQGRKVASLSGAEATTSRVVEAMIGERGAALNGAGGAIARGQPATRAQVLEVKNVSLKPEPGNALAAQELHGITFAVAGGELFGIAGVEGNGQQELELVLVGLLQPSAGEVRLLGEAGILRDRLAYIPSDGQRLGLIRDLTLAENLMLPETGRGSPWRVVGWHSRHVLARVRNLIAQFNIYPPDPLLRARQLSGGNAQKLLLARELGRKPILIIAAQPTMGLDIASAAFVRRELRRAAEGGAAVVMISSDLDELLDCCDRIGVLYRGAMQAQWGRQNLNVAEIGAAMAGMSSNQELAVQ